MPFECRRHHGRALVRYRRGAALWIGLFSYDADVARIGALYLHIVGPVYGC